ncbi:unnamed protein product [Nippostrongylus brasiliensis]|uniref:Polyribonucleotide nucleotidyltransferase n=1 Tax=Nippostrongylus brasiliensis TaxID=27835 RepID=A0A0N4YCN1_NIPBR|nr:unnamed protein product [Nippostrongylus brasiliensis]
MARFASGAVVASCGNNAVLSTCVYRKSSGEPQHGQDFVPFLVDFKQSAAAVGKIPTNYLRRELGQTDADILASRVIDRSLRPLFPRGWTNETQHSMDLHLAPNSILPIVRVALMFSGEKDARKLINVKIVVKPLCVDDEGDAVLLGLNAAASSLHVSAVPWLGPVAAVRVGLVDGKLHLNPNRSLMKHSNMDLLLAGCDQRRTVMIEMDGDSEVRALCEERLYYILTDPSHDKISRDEAISRVNRIFSMLIVDNNMRCDGRGITDIRPITITVDVFKRLHGSSLFQRGQTQVMSTVTFDSPAAAFHSDSISQLLGSQRKKMFMLHYEFPSYATNEIATSRGSNRRELGHGALAEKALKHVVPKEFPYKSNGSSSMASVCGGSLALLDAGVPLTSSVAGVAIGLVTDKEAKKPHKVLTDILGIEDYAGDMDFKIAGSSRGFTAMQLDVKIPGLTRAQLSESFQSATNGIDHILHKMSILRDRPREEFKESVPVVSSMRLDAYKRQTLFRAGGLHAKAVEAETDVKIYHEDDLHIGLFAPNKQRLEEAKALITKLLSETDEPMFAFGQMVSAEVVELQERGALLQLAGVGRPIFVPNSQLNATPIRHSSASGLQVRFRLHFVSSHGLLISHCESY